jgi:hypothetical protein
MALSDLPRFRKLVATMKPIVDFSERGLGGGGDGEGSELERVDRQILSEAERIAAQNPRMLYGQVMKMVAAEKSDLVARRDELARK